MCERLPGLALGHRKLPTRDCHHGIREARVLAGVAEPVDGRLRLVEPTHRGERLTQGRGRAECGQRVELLPRLGHKTSVGFGTRQVARPIGQLGEEPVRREQPKREPLLRATSSPSEIQ